MSKLKQIVKSIVRSISSSIKREQNTQVEQTMIANQYRLMQKMLTPQEMPKFKDVGFKVHSQFDEDGILLYIFSIIGTVNKRVVEICAGDGIVCMAANLIINHGWDALLFDGDRVSVANGIKYYKLNPSTSVFPPKFVRAWITKDNIDKLITDNGFTGEIDLLSIDIDGNDYYIMEAIQSVKPRVIICETHNVVPANLAVTMPYKEDYYYLDGKQHEEFRSVSLLAMQKLLSQRGYKLVGAHKYGFNAIFMLKELGKDIFPEVTVEEVSSNPYSVFRREKAWNEVKDLPWVKV